MRNFIACIFALAGAAHLSAAERTDKILIQGNAAGTQTVRQEPGGAVRAEYSYNDRGRGDHIVATWKLDAAGVPDRVRRPRQRLHEGAGRGAFRHQGRQGELEEPQRTRRAGSHAAQAFYLPINAPPEFYGVLARALLKAPNHKLALLPAGEASIEAAGKRQASVRRQGEADAIPHHRSRLLAAVDLARPATAIRPARVELVLGRAGRQSKAAFAQLQAAQDKADNAWSAQLAQELTHAPKGDLVIRNARLFDPRDLAVTPGTSVLVRGERIVRVAPDADLKAAAPTPKSSMRTAGS